MNRRSYSTIVVLASAAVLALGIPGVDSEREYRRYYPSAEVAGHLTGFTDIDDVAGFERGPDDLVDVLGAGRRVEHHVGLGPAQGRSWVVDDVPDLLAELGSARLTRIGDGQAPLPQPFGQQLRLQLRTLFARQLETHR